MDSKSIYIGAKNTERFVCWQGEEHDGWIHIGDERCFDPGKAQEAVNSFFDEETIYLSVDRHKGFELSKSKASLELSKHMKNDVWLVDKAFKNLMVFSSKGVYRCGKINS